MTRHPRLDCTTCQRTGHLPDDRRCPVCHGHGTLHRAATITDIARRHGTTVAAAFAGVSTDTVRTIRHQRDPDYTRGRGHPTTAELEAAQPSTTCPCARCVDLTVTAALHRAAQLARLQAALDPGDESWRRHANCLGIDPDVFFPTQGESNAPARAVCAGCQVRDECLTYALDTGQAHGTWGGTSERERRRMRRQEQTG